MKLVIAVISPDKLEAIRGALPEPDAYIYYVSLVGDVHDPVHGSYRGGSFVEPRVRLRVEIIVVNEILLEEVVRAVMLAASLKNGYGFCSGNIFVLPLENWIHIPDGKSEPEPHSGLKEKISS